MILIIKLNVYQNEGKVKGTTYLLTYWFHGRTHWHTSWHLQYVSFFNVRNLQEKAELSINTEPNQGIMDLALLPSFQWFFQNCIAHHLSDDLWCSIRESRDNFPSLYIIKAKAERIVLCCLNSLVEAEINVTTQHEFKFTQRQWCNCMFNRTHLLN